MLSGMIRKDGVFLPVAAAFFVSLFVYLLTMSRSVGWHDSAELALTAWLFAPNHAPGSPLHTLIAHLPATFLSEAHFGTTLVSVIAAALSAGLLAGLIHRFAGNILLSVLAAMVFALSFQVWASAVVTELYSLSMVFLAVAMLAAWSWQDSRSEAAWKFMLLGYGLSLGAYFANVLLLPAFAFLIYRSAVNPVRKVMVFGVFTTIVVLLIAAANYLLALNTFPFGAVIPDSLAGLFGYMSGAQHDPLAARVGSGLGLSRLVEHLEIFSRSIVYVPVLLATIGFYAFLKKHAVYAWFTAFIFLIYIIYYTLFGSGDYYLMVGPAYFVTAIWVASGVLWVNEKLHWSRSSVPGCALLAIILSAQLFLQFEGRRAMARDKSAEIFAAEAFEFLPQGSVAIAGWRELTTLNYFQAIHGDRTDIRFLLPARTLRHYRHGVVEDYVPFINELVCKQPVYTMKPVPDLSAVLEPVAGVNEADWRRIKPAAGSCDSD
jgi:hypothetical protein